MQPAQGRWTRRMRRARRSMLSERERRRWREMERDGDLFLLCFVKNKTIALL